MNAIFTAVLIISLGLLLFNNPSLALNAMLTGGEKAIALTIKLWAIYAVWLGILQIVEDTGLHNKIAKMLNPIINLLMGKQPTETKNQIAINLTANILGMGNACTPSGINATTMLCKNQSKATSAVIMFLILNTTSLQILPTTIISLRMLAGSANPSNIILPCFLATCASTIIGIVLVKICSLIFKDDKT